MKLLVTGGAGFIGSHLVDALIAEGHDVVVVDDLSAGKMENVNPAATFHKLDICDPSLADLIHESKPDAIYHQAAHVNLRRSVEEPGYDARINILGSINLFRAAASCSSRVIYASTGGAIYGEADELPATEETPTRPTSPYGLAKYSAERYLQLIGELHELEYVILRYANVYGPRQQPEGEAGVVAIFSRQLLRGERPTIFGDGTKTRDYVNVRDVAAANLAVIDKGTGNIFNVGRGVPVSDDEIFQEVRDALSSDIGPRYGSKRKGEVDHIYLDSSELQRLGWKPTVSLADGVAEAVAYYRDLFS